MSVLSDNMIIDGNSDNYRVVLKKDRRKLKGRR
jgi:hypothetical protein